MDEAGLARLASKGNSDAFGKLVEQYTPSARRVARAVLRDDDEADDAVQDGVLAAWKAIERFDPDRPFRPWLMRIVVNAALDRRRRDKVRKTEAIPESAESHFVGPDRHTDAVIAGARIREALAQLPERQRIAVVLFDAEGYSHAEIAALLGVPEGTVRSYVFHGRRALRRSLGPIKEELR